MKSLRNIYSEKTFIFIFIHGLSLDTTFMRYSFNLQENKTLLPGSPFGQQLN